MRALVAPMMVSLFLGSTAAAQTPPKTDRKVRGVRIIPAQEAPPAPPAPEPRPAPVYPVSPVPAETAPASTSVPAAAARCDRAFATADLTYADTPAFDARLRELLNGSSAASRVVDAPAFATELPPSRLQPWLAEVQRTGGTVSAREIRCARTRGFNVLKFLSKLFKPPTESFYAPAKNWNVVLWTEAAGGQVRQVQFTRRTAA